MDFDFDVMAALAKDAPSVFASKRSELIRHAIESCADPQAGASLQREIDAYKAQASVEQKDIHLAIMEIGLSALRDRVAQRLAGIRPITCSPMPTCESRSQELC